MSDAVSLHQKHSTLTVRVRVKNDEFITETARENLSPDIRARR